MKCTCSCSGRTENSETGHFDIFSRLMKERILFLCEEIDASVATTMAATLLFLDLQDPDKEITIYINSIGGSVTDGLLTIYDTLQYIKSPIRTICIGEASSSAAVILAAGTKGRRFAYPNAKIMIHNIQVEEMSGTHKEIQEEAKRVKELNQTLMKIISTHTGQPIRKVKKDCEKDKYFDPQEGIKYGLIDFIIVPAKSVSA